MSVRANSLSDLRFIEKISFEGAIRSRNILIRSRNDANLINARVEEERAAREELISALNGCVRHANGIPDLNDESHVAAINRAADADRAARENVAIYSDVERIDARNAVAAHAKAFEAHMARKAHEELAAGGGARGGVA